MSKSDSRINENLKRQSSLSVVFSFFNEQEVLPELIKRTREALKPLKNKGILSWWEMVFVNDDSTDNSEEILMQHAKGNDDIRIVNMSRNFGVSPCVMAGLAYAKGDNVVYMDADLQDPPEVIPELLKKREETGAEVVHTVRESRKGEGPVKMGVTKIGYLILNKVSNVKIPIEAGDFKLLSRRAVNHLLQLREKRPFMRGLVSWIGFKQEFVPYHRNARQFGKAKFPVFSRSVISNFFGSALISFSSAPLMIASFFGLLAIFVDFFLVGHVLFEKFSGKAIPGWSAIMIAVLFLGGVQLFCVGIIGLYLHSVHEQTKQRPNYIVESTFGFSKDS